MERGPYGNKRENTRIKLLTTAAKLFAEKGLALTGAKDIAEGAGLSVGLMYHYYKTKEEVFGALVETALAEMQETTATLLQPGCPKENLLAYANIALAEMHAGYDFARWMALLSQPLPDSCDAGLRASYKAYEAALTDALVCTIQQGQKLGLFHSGSAQMLAQLFLATVQGLCAVQLTLQEAFRVPTMEALIAPITSREKGGDNMNKTVITISREYGSGGRDVGRLLAEALALPVFDDEIIHLAAEASGLCADTMKQHDEKTKSVFIENLKRLSVKVPSLRVPSGYHSIAALHNLSTRNYKGTDADQLFQAKANVIRDMADKGGCIIIGRCSGYILRENPNLLSVFIRGDFDDRVQRTIATYQMPAKDAIQNVKKVDKYRANHYHFYTGRQWGHAANYDLVINTSNTGIPGAVAAIKAIIQNKGA